MLVQAPLGSYSDKNFIHWSASWSCIDRSRYVTYCSADYEPQHFLMKTSNSVYTHASPWGKKGRSCASSLMDLHNARSSVLSDGLPRVEPNLVSVALTFRWLWRVRVRMEWSLGLHIGNGAQGRNQIASTELLSLKFISNKYETSTIMYVLLNF